MDDLDHSMHIAEFDWSSFCDDSEECCLLQPSLARPDNLSDTDDPENSASGVRADQQESCVERSEELTDTAAHVQEETHDDIPTSTLEDPSQESPGDSQTPVKEDERVQTQSDENSREQPDVLSVHETLSADRQAVGEDGGTAERERWFVTVNYSPARPRPRGLSVKKKRRQKNSSKSRRATSCRPDRCDKEESGEGRNREEEERRGCQGAESGSDLSEKEAVRAGDQPPGGSLAPVGSYETFTAEACSQEGRTGESQEVSSSHTCDSDCYFSAAESVGDTEHRHEEYPQLLESTNPPRRASVLTQDVKPQHGRYEGTNVGLAVTAPSADHKVHEIPEDFSTSDTNTSGAELHGCSEKNIPTSVRDELSPGTDLTGTPCSTADDPGAHAQAAGQSRQVFAISAFWDEMEKLTINDILHLRMSQDLPESEARQSQAANVDASVTKGSCLAHSGQCSTPDVGLTDLSDTTDSDYFTQAEESKPDRSSCEVSTSDFEDEGWQFIQERTRDFPCSSSKVENVSEEDEESLSSEGRGTPVASFEDFSGLGFEDWESHTLKPGLMRKSKTMSDIRTLDQRNFSDPFSDGRRFFSRCQSVEETLVLEVSDSLDTLTSASNYDTDVLGEQQPELWDNFSLDDKSKLQSWCLDGFGPGDLSVVPVFDHTLRDQVSVSVLLDSLWNADQPVPIFSCPQYVRGITVPKMFPKLKDDFPPIRVVSGSLTGARGWTNSWRTPLSANRFDMSDVLTEGHVPAASPLVFREPTAQRHIVELKETAGKSEMFGFETHDTELKES